MFSLSIPNFSFDRLHLGSKSSNPAKIRPERSKGPIRSYSPISSYGCIWAIHTIEILAKFFSSYSVEIWRDGVSGHTTSTYQISASGDLWLLRKCHSYVPIVVKWRKFSKSEIFEKIFFLQIGWNLAGVLVGISIFVTTNFRFWRCMVPEKMAFVCRKLTCSENFLSSTISVTSNWARWLKSGMNTELNVFSEHTKLQLRSTSSRFEKFKSSQNSTWALKRPYTFI